MRPDTKLHWKGRTLDHDFMIIITKGNEYLYIYIQSLLIYKLMEPMNDTYPSKLRWS